MIHIKDISGNIRFSTPINEGSKRKFLLMKEDYITLKFSLGSPIYFQLGDYIDNELGIFELTDLYKPTYNKTTGAYDYELRLDAYYWKWKNKKFFYTPETTGREAGWNLTAPLKTHLEVFITNLKALGYKFRNQDFIWEIDDTVANTSKLVSYDNVNLIDALTQMAETWECEWWVDNHKIRFGRCEFSSPVDFKAGNLMDTENVNVNSMQRNDSQTAYATRVYAFGSTRNIPSSYRKNLIFDVKKVNRREVSDTERTLDIKYFPISSYIPAPEIKTNLSGDKSPDFTQRPAIHSIYIPFADRLNAGNYKIIPNDISVCAYADSATSSSLRKLTSTLSLAYSINGKDKSVLIQSVEGKFVDPQKLLADFKESSFILEEDAVDCMLVLKSVAENFSTGSNNYFVSSCISTIQSEAKAANVSITFLAGINKGKTFKAVYNPDFLTGENSNVVRLPDGVVASLGDRYTINNIIKGKVPDSYFSKDDKELTLNGIVQKRLMFPEGIPYVDAYRYSPTGERIDIGDERYDNPDSVEMPKEEAVEEIVIFEDEYPKYNGSVTSISYEEKDEIDEETKNSTGNKYRIYTFKDTEIKNFNQKDFVIAELRIAFQTGYLAGLDFALNVKESDGTGTTFEIARNDDYGRYLPDDVLFPQTVHMENNVEVPADTYILHGFDTAFISEQMLPDSEQSLLEKAQDYVKKSMIDPSTYNCEMDNTYIYNNGNIRVFEVGDRVNLVNKAYFPDGRQSRIIGFEWPLDIPYDHPIYTIGETAAYSRIGEIESKIDSLTYKGQTYSGPSVGDGGTSVYVIGVNDKTPPSDRNVFSSKKSLDTFLRKDQPNAAEKVITFLEGLISDGLITAGNGIQFGKSFASGLTGHGGSITSAGHGELRSLRVNEWFETSEFRYNYVDVTTGEKWSAPGGGIIESVVMDTDPEGNELNTGVVTLKLEAGQIGAVAFDDLAMGMYHYESGNATEDYDDGKGNRRFAGFTTVFFRITEIIGTGLNSKFRFELRNASDNYPNPVSPTAMMHFVCFGNVSNKSRQSSMYQTRTYTRYLKNVDWWEYSFSNIAMQFGDLANLSVFGADMTGYSAYVDSLYFTGKIEQLEKIVEDTLGTGDLRMEIDSSDGYFVIDNKIDTTLTAKVLRYFKNVTGEVARWEWTRESGTDLVDIASDAIWNEDHSSARESVHITENDVRTDSVKFICEATVGVAKVREEVTF